MLLAVFDHGVRGGDGPHLFPFLLLLLLGYLIFRFVRRRRGGDGGAWSHHHQASPMQTLKDRFARGEIDRAEYEHRKAVLEGADVIPPAPVAQQPSTPTAGQAPTASEEEE